MMNESTLSSSAPQPSAMAVDPRSQCPLYSELADDLVIGSFVRSFIGKLPAKVADFKAMFSRSDWDGISTFAHQLKGTGGSVGLPQLSLVAGDIEFEVQKPSVDSAAVSRLIAEAEMLSQQAQLGLNQPLIRGVAGNSRKTSGGLH